MKFEKKLFVESNFTSKNSILKKDCSWNISKKLISEKDKS